MQNLHFGNIVRSASYSFITRTFSQEQQEIWKSWVGKRVQKKTGKPFKSSFKIGTVSGVCTHPVTQHLCFTFAEDVSYVEAFRCELVV